MLNGMIDCRCFLVELPGARPSRGGNAMNQYTDIPLCESLDEFGWDHDEFRDLIRTTQLRFGDDGQPVGYEGEQLFGLEAAYLGSRSL
jgi:hypothetical protein